MKRGGFTLAEVLVSLAVLSLGLLGVSGLVAVAGRTVSHARALEWAVAAAQEVADSLVLFGVAVPGRRLEPWGEVEWWTEGAGPSAVVRIRAVPVQPGGAASVEVAAAPRPDSLP